MAKLDPRTWRRFLNLARPFFVSEARWIALGMVVLLISFSLGINWINVRISYITRDFMSALSVKDQEQFLHHLLWLLAVMALYVPVAVFKSFTEERFGLMWRRWLNHEVIGRYFRDRAYHAVNTAEGIDNPDQRISEDVRTFTALSLSFSLILFNSVIQFSLFINILADISYRLVVAVIAYALFGSAITYLLGRPLIFLNFTQLQREADYRYKLVNVRENAESIAFLGGERTEATRVRQRLKEALKNFRQIINWNRNLGFFTTGFNSLTPIIPTIIVAPLYVQGTIKDFGVVAQAGMAFGFVLGALSILVANFANLSNFAAVITRLGSLWEALETSGHPREQTIELLAGDGICFRSVNLYTPKRDRLIAQDLSFELKTESLLIAGPSGCGKSSLLRAVAGLWTTGNGQIVRPPLGEMIFLPQRPYMILGSFRSQILYGTGRRGLTDQELLALLEEVGLTPTLERVGGLSVVLPWPNILSSGEQQLIQFARLVLARRRYVFLDEATTALDTETERRVYDYVASLTPIHVSVGSRRDIGSYHDWVLQHRGGGKWSFERP